MADEPAKPSPPPPAVEPAFPPEPRTAWQPFTFGGVAAFAQASCGRLFVVQLITALLVAGSTVWFLKCDFVPVINQTVQKLPDAAGVTNGELQGFGAVQTSETKFLSITFAPNGDTEFDRSADLQVVFTEDRLVVSSLLSSVLGSFVFDYNTDSNLDLSRGRLEPMWGAWQPVLLVGAGLVVVLGLMALWTVLALIYAPIAKVVAWLADRKLSWLGAWRLASASMLAGAGLMAIAVLLYSWQVVDIFGFGWLEAVHLVAGWVYLVGGAICTPRLPDIKEVPASRNPFTS